MGRDEPRFILCGAPGAVNRSRREPRDWQLAMYSCSRVNSRESRLAKTSTAPPSYASHTTAGNRRRSSPGRPAARSPPRRHLPRLIGPHAATRGAQVDGVPARGSRIRPRPGSAGSPAPAGSAPHVAARDERGHPPRRRVRHLEERDADALAVATHHRADHLEPSRVGRQRDRTVTMLFTAASVSDRTFIRRDSGSRPRRIHATVARFHRGRPRRRRPRERPSIVTAHHSTLTCRGLPVNSCGRAGSP